MIIGVGTDIARVARFERAIARHGERFVERLLGEDERVDFRDRGRSANYLAKRFAAKEAFVKALGTGLRHGMRWTEIQVVNDTLGRPALRLSGAPMSWPGRRVSAVFMCHCRMKRPLRWPSWYWRADGCPVSAGLPWRHKGPAARVPRRRCRAT